jgi:hypothetical protein
MQTTAAPIFRKTAETFIDVAKTLRPFSAKVTARQAGI